MFDEFWRDFQLPRWTDGDPPIAIRVAVSEDDEEIPVTVELPTLSVSGRPGRQHAPGQRIATKRI